MSFASVVCVDGDGEEVGGGGGEVEVELCVPRGVGVTGEGGRGGEDVRAVRELDGGDGGHRVMGVGGVEVTGLMEGEGQSARVRG